MRYVLILQAEKASAFAVGRAEFGVAVVFTNDPSGHEQFVRYLQERRHSLFSVVLDSKDEEHHHDPVPVLGRRDRIKFLNKIVARHFPENALSIATVDKVHHRTKKEVSVTSSGLPPGHDCQVWLEILNAQSTLMTDISSLSLLGLAIHRVSGTRMSLVVIQIAQNDYRLMAYLNARLLISRHLSVSENAAVELIDHLKQTQEYLAHLPAVAKDNTVGPGTAELQAVGDSTMFGSVQIVGALTAESRKQLEQAGIKVTGCRAMSQLLGIKPEVAVPFADALFAALAARPKSAQARFGMGSYRNHYLSRRLRHVLYAGSIICCGVTAAATGAAVHVNDTYTSLITASNVVDSGSSESVLFKSARLVPDDYPVDAIRASMRIAAHMQATTQFTPLHFLSSLATDLTVYPEIEVTGIHWSRMDGDPEQVLSKLLLNDLNGEHGVNYNATVKGLLQLQPSERALALGRFNSFVAALNSTGLYSSVTVIDAPFGTGGGFGTGDGLPSLQEPFVIELETRKTSYD